jgi:hypothetical protein
VSWGQIAKADEAWADFMTENELPGGVYRWVAGPGTAKDSKMDFYAVWITDVAVACCASGAMASDCQPSEWGADDQIGAANRITPERTVAAAQLVKQGASHPLGIVITPGMPAYPPRFTQLQVLQPEHPYSETSNAFGWEASANDDLVQMWLGTGPQLDGFGTPWRSGGVL